MWFSIVSSLSRCHLMPLLFIVSSSNKVGLLFPTLIALLFLMLYMLYLLWCPFHGIIYFCRLEKSVQAI